MEANFIREGSCHYLAVAVCGLPESDYQMPMLLQNKIPGLLPVHMQVMDGTAALYYEVTSCQSLSSCFEADKMTLKDILRLLLHMSHISEEIERYLLRATGIVLDPEYIFTDADGQTIVFCYDPCGNTPVSEGLNSVSRFILDHIDYDDRDCTELAYGLFQESMKESVSIADFARRASEYGDRDLFEEEIDRKRENDEKEQDDQCINEEKNGNEKNIWDWEIRKQDSSGEEPRENQRLGTGKQTGLEMMTLACLNAAVLIGFVWGIWELKTVFRLDDGLAAGIGIAGAAAAAAAVVLVHRVLFDRIIVSW